MTALLKSQIQPVEAVQFPARSALVSYDNMSRLFESDKHTYKGGPNLKNTVASPTELLAKYSVGRNEKYYLLWSYNAANGVTAKSAINPAAIGGVVNGYYAGNDLRFGAVTLYGARCPATGNSSSDPSNPADVLRLLGDHPDDASIPDTQIGISSWARRNAAYGAVTVHFDDPVMAAGSVPLGGTFWPTSDKDFNPHNGLPGTTFNAYLRSRYANDAAHLADRANALNYYDKQKELRVSQARNFWKNVAGPRVKQLGLISTGNVFAPWPSESPETGHGVADCFDSVMFELPWFYYNYDRANYRATRAAAEDMATATTMRASFASMSMQYAYFQGAGKRGAVAVYPLSAWIPPLSGSAGSAPQSTAYTEPYKVRAHQRASFSWAWAWGFCPIVPAGIYDNIFDAKPTEAGHTDYSGYVGVNKPLFYGDPAHYADMFGFAAAHPYLFDDFQAVSTIALMMPVPGAETPWYAGGPNQVNTLYWVTNYLRPLIESRVPFTVLPVGGSVRAIATSSYSTNSYSKVVKMDSDANFTARGAAIPVGANVTDYTTFFSGGLAQYSPLTISGETDSTRPVLATLRAKADLSELAVHLVNTNNCDYAANAGAGAAQPAQTGLTVTVKTAYLPRRRLMGVELFRPGQTGGTPARYSISANGIDVYPSSVTEYAVIRLLFE